MSDRFTSPRFRYLQHRASAKRRGIEFDLTFDEWWEIWRDRYPQRGRGSEQMQMCRRGDEGPYAAGNVRIASAAENHAEATSVKIRRDLAKTWDSSSAGPSWLHDRGRTAVDYFTARARAEAAEAAGLFDDED